MNIRRFYIINNINLFTPIRIYPFSKVFFNNDILTLSPIENFGFLTVISKL